jgi:putative flavoprotein involved in K+ transport
MNAIDRMSRATGSITVLTPVMADGAMLDAIVIGAGWAGLGVSHALARAGLRHRVLERDRIGATWRTQRWDTFRMNSTKIQTVMPGDGYEGPDPDGFMTRDEFVALLEDFATRNRLPVETNTPVLELARDAEDGVFHVTTPRGTLRAGHVVIASGSQNRARRPAAATALPPNFLQIDACDYRRPAALPRGAVLVVGSAQSGGQIAQDLIGAGRTVFLATARAGRMPRQYRGKDIFVWLEQSGLFDVPRQMEPSGRIEPRPLVGAIRTISLQSLSAQGAVLLGRLTGVEDGHLTFADDLQDNIRFADEASAKVKRKIDDYIARHGFEAPDAIEDPAEAVAPHLPDPPILSLDPSQSGLTTVIWCTGFTGDFSWVRLPGVLDVQGQPMHQEGITALPGLYFAGLESPSSRRAGTMLGIAEEARRIVEHISQRIHSAPTKALRRDERQTLPTSKQLAEAG